LAAESLTGCASEPFAATTNLRPEPDEVELKEVLSADEQQQAVRAMRAAAGPWQVREAPTAARWGVRWSDIPAALAEACYEQGVEMAVISTAQYDWGYRFGLRTVEDRPVELQVYRRDEPVIYEAKAWVGRFRNDDARARRLLSALEKQLRLFGRKPAFQDPLN
jgi:hypothetical protein